MQRMPSNGFGRGTRMFTPAWPAWYASVLQANSGVFPSNTLYSVGARWDDATNSFNAKEVWPEGTYAGGSLLYAGTDGTFPPMVNAYGGSVYVPELGKFGTMVFGNTGENVIQEQLALWSISNDAPAYDVFQNPSYQLTASAATAAGASWYYNVADYNALAPAKQMPWSAGTGNLQTTWASAWDKTFPVGIANWVIPAKVGISELGSQRPISFRYNGNVYIPPAMTGISAGAILVNDASWHGPFNGNRGPIPDGVTPAQWFTDLWPSGRQKFWIYALNVQTKVWTAIVPVPDFIENSHNYNIAHPYAFVDTAAKRVYYTGGQAGNLVLTYVDFSAGISGVTMGGPTAVAGAGGSDFSSSHSNIDLFIGTSGVLNGAKLYYYKNGNNRLGVLDLVANTCYDLVLANPPPTSGNWWMALDQANAMVYITIKDPVGNTVTLWKFAIPSTPGTAASYTVIGPTTVNMNGVTLETALGNAPYGHRHQLLPGLGVVLLTQRYGNMLAFRPN